VRLIHATQKSFSDRGTDQQNAAVLLTENTALLFNWLRNCYTQKEQTPTSTFLYVGGEKKKPREYYQSTTQDYETGIQCIFVSFKRYQENNRKIRHFMNIEIGFQEQFQEL